MKFLLSWFFPTRPPPPWLSFSTSAPLHQTDPHRVPFKVWLARFGPLSYGTTGLTPPHHVSVVHCEVLPVFFVCGGWSFNTPLRFPEPVSLFFFCETRRPSTFHQLTLFSPSDKCLTTQAFCCSQPGTYFSLSSRPPLGPPVLFRLRSCPTRLFASIPRFPSPVVFLPIQSGLFVWPPLP